MNCSDCPNYYRGKGNKACLNCKQYIEAIKVSGRRSSIPIDIVPQIILEAIPDNNQINLKAAIKMLPLNISTPLIMYYILNANQQEIADYLNISQKQVSKKINFALDMIKEMAVSEP